MFLALLCAILTVVLVVELKSGDEVADVGETPREKPRPGESAQEDKAQSGFVMPAQNSYAEVSERPLFFRSRRPPPPELETKEETPADTSRAAFVLSGVILTGTQRMALLQTQSSAKVARVEEGEEYEGWTVEAIHPDKVVMRRGAEVSEILLEDKVRSPSPLKRRGAPQRSIPKRSTPKQAPETQDGGQEEKDQ
jgi:type II secretory pathway component PulC